MRYIAIDYGTKRTGIAICDPSETFVSPLKTISTSDWLCEKIIEIVKEEQVAEIVVGLPINMDGTAGNQAKITTEFAKKLEKLANIPVSLYDERLSSFAAGEKLAPAEYTNKGKKKRLDAVAAACILEAFLVHKKEAQ